MLYCSCTYKPTMYHVERLRRRAVSLNVIDKRDSIPYYRQLADILRQEIDEHASPAGKPYALPSEHELCTIHGVTRTTVRHALDILEREGLVCRRRGKGTFVAVRRVEQDVTQLVSTTEDMRKRGWPLVTKVLSLNSSAPSENIRGALELEPGQEVHRLERLRLMGDEPLSLQVSCLPTHLCPSLETNELSGSLYRLLEGRYDLQLWTARQVLRARGATGYEAELLQVRTGAPLMYAERVTYAASGVAIEYLESVWCGDRYDFTVVLSRPK